MAEREIILDTETTGLRPDEGHRVVEIGCIELVNYVPTGRVYHAYVNPERPMPPEAFAVHGLSDDFLREKPLFSAVVDEFLEFVGDSPVIAHNARFDMGFVNAELARIQRSILSPPRVIDTADMARRKFPGAPASLDALCKRFNIDNSSRTKHGALLDAELLAEVYIELIGGRQTSLDIAAGGVVVVEESTFVSQAWPDRVFTASDDELAAHAEFVRKLKEPIGLLP
jgi:DNA polymerase-3 subunit epsilon